MPSHDGRPPILFVPDGVLGEGAERVFSELNAGSNEHASQVNGAEGCTDQSARSTWIGTEVELTNSTHVSSVYSDVVAARPLGLLVFEMIGVYVSSMRIFIRRRLPVDKHDCVDQQIISAMSYDEQSDLRKRLARNRRRCLIHVIDTKHFPIIVGEFWGAFERYFSRDKDDQETQLWKIHSIRNDVCHPAVGDITKHRAKSCYKSIGDVLECTGPPEAESMLEAIWRRVEIRRERAAANGRADRAFLDTLGKMDETIDAVSDLVKDLRRTAAKLV